MRAGAFIDSAPYTHEDKRSLHCAYNLVGPGLPRPYVHEGCTCNEIVSLRNRVLFKVPSIKCDLRPFRKVAVKIGRFLQDIAHRMSYEEAILTMLASKRQRYYDAAEHLKYVGITEKDARISAFLKFERLPECLKDPRMIQFRNPIYGVELATYLKAIEHTLYRLPNWLFDGCKTRLVGNVIAKCHNSVKRANQIKRKFETFNNPVVFSLDCSRWDAHVQIEHLKIEHTVYNVAFQDPHLAKLLKWQLVNQGTTANGIKYKCPGNRMSGDMNTALGNCILMTVFVETIMAGRNHQIYDDGDDCLVFCEREEMDEVQSLIAAGFANLGFSLKFENLAFRLEDVRFCQSAPVHTDKGWTMVRSPFKIMGFGLMGTKYLNNGDASVATYTRSCGVAGVALSSGVPVLQAYYQRLIEIGEQHGGAVKTMTLSHLGGFFRLATDFGRVDLEDGTDRSHPITHDARLSFQSAWGITIEEQLEYESLFQELEFPSFSKTIGVDWLEGLAPEWLEVDHQ